MKKSTQKQADQLLPEVKSIESVLPEIIRIVSEGNAVTRVANFLRTQGWTDTDLWREFPKLWVGDDFKSGVRNAIRDWEQFSRVADGTGNWLVSLKHSLKQMKKKARQAPPPPG